MADVMGLFGQRRVGAAIQPDLAFTQRQKTGERAQKSRFPGAVAAEHEQGFARPQFKIDAANNRPATAIDAQSVGGNRLQGLSFRQADFGWRQRVLPGGLTV